MKFAPTSLKAALHPQGLIHELLVREVHPRTLGAHPPPVDGGLLVVVREHLGVVGLEGRQPLAVVQAVA